MQSKATADFFDARDTDDARKLCKQTRNKSNECNAADANARNAKIKALRLFLLCMKTSGIVEEGERWKEATSVKVTKLIHAYSKFFRAQRYVAAEALPGPSGSLLVLSRTKSALSTFSLDVWLFRHRALYKMPPTTISSYFCNRNQA